MVLSGLQFFFYEPLFITKILKLFLGSLLPNGQFIKGSRFGSKLLVVSSSRHSSILKIFIQSISRVPGSQKVLAQSGIGFLGHSKLLVDREPGNLLYSKCLVSSLQTSGQACR
jgi:hypothetical protein